MTDYTGYIDRDLVIDLYRKPLEDGYYTSCGHVAQLLNESGVEGRNEEISRQAVHYILRNDPEGKRLLEYKNLRADGDSRTLEEFLDDNPLEF